MPSGFNLRQKDISVGSGLNIEYSQTGAGILISAVDTTNTTVRIYDATVEEATGVITITDGTQVAELAIGDEIRTPDGVYQKVKDGITTTGPADGTRIKVSGITSPSDANGYYALQSENVWKHETANYWITLLFNTAYYWMISNKSDPSDVQESLFYYGFSAGDINPWETDGRWHTNGSAAGEPQLENVEASTTITNTIDLFEYASTSVASADIVQSVNGNKPDASGNVTIDVTQSGLESVSTGAGLTGDGTAGDPITLDLSNYIVESDIHMRSSGPYSVELLKGTFGITINNDGTIKLASINTSIVLGIDITYNNNPQNTAGGFAIVGSNGKLPDTILPSYVKTVNNVAPDGTGNVSIELPDGGLTSVSVGNGLTGNGTSSSPIKLDLSTAVMEHNCAIDAQGHSFIVNNFGTASIQNTYVNVSMSNEFVLSLPVLNINITINEGGIDIQTTAITLNGRSQNTAGGFAIVGEDGKLPSSIIPVSSNRHPFTSSDLSSNVLTMTTTGNVTGVIDDSGKAWNFADEEVTYTDSTVSVDLSGVFARKGIATPTGTWKLMLYGA